MSSTARPVLVVEDVAKSYGPAWALRRVSFRVGEGEVLGLLGPNGAGKTSLIRMLLDLTRPDSGRIAVLGEEPSSRTRERMGYLPEERGLYPKQKVIDVLSYLVSLAGLPALEARRRSHDWLQRVGLGEWERRRVRELSKGMQQKVQLGAAILHDPALVILDEPFSGLDPINRRIVADVVRELRDKGAAVIVSTHMISEVEHLCDRVVLLRKGHLLLQGPTYEVRQRFAEASVSLSATDGWQVHPAVAPLILDCKTKGDKAEITLVEGVDTQALLAALLKSGIRVDHFSKNIPSLDDVFVLAVAADGPRKAPPSSSCLESCPPAGGTCEDATEEPGPAS